MWIMLGLASGWTEWSIDSQISANLKSRVLHELYVQIYIKSSTLALQGFSAIWSALRSQSLSLTEPW